MQGERGSEMLTREAEGLRALAATDEIHIPRVIGLTRSGYGAALILEYIERQPPKPDSMTRLGRRLAHMHGHRATRFGWETNNFIGRLDQINTREADWAVFYGRHRLAYQMRLAVRNGLMSAGEVPAEENLIAHLRMHLPAHIGPALLHGDLWSGNYLFGPGGTPFLIDPAVYYGHAEVDLAMTRLFGGFDKSFYAAYREVRPCDGDENYLTDIYQLYYLLVHLNLFGSSYYSSVRRIMDRYFGRSAGKL